MLHFGCLLIHFQRFILSLHQFHQESSSLLKLDCRFRLILLLLLIFALEAYYRYRILVPFLVLALSFLQFRHAVPLPSYYMFICVLGSLPFPARRQILSFTICRIFYPEKHKCRCMRQWHLNKERNFFGGESVLCIGKISLPHLLYTVYQIFWCTQIFVGFFDGNKKKRLTALFSNTETFFFYVFSYVLQCICLGINHLSSIHLWH